MGVQRHALVLELVEDVQPIHMPISKEDVLRGIIGRLETAAVDYIPSIKGMYMS